MYEDLFEYLWASSYDLGRIHYLCDLCLQRSLNLARAVSSGRGIALETSLYYSKHGIEESASPIVQTRTATITATGQQLRGKANSTTHNKITIYSVNENKRDVLLRMHQGIALQNNNNNNNSQRVVPALTDIPRSKQTTSRQ